MLIDWDAIQAEVEAEREKSGSVLIDCERPSPDEEIGVWISHSGSFDKKFPVMPEPLYQPFMVNYQPARYGSVRQVVSEKKSETTLSQIFALVAYEDEDNPLSHILKNLFLVRDDKGVAHPVMLVWEGALTWGIYSYDPEVWEDVRFFQVEQ